MSAERTSPSRGSRRRAGAARPETLFVLGAGSVGLALGARLARAGTSVCFVVRRPEQARALERGVRVWDPATDAAFRVEVPAVVGPGAAAIGRSPVLICTRASDTEAVAERLARAAPEALPVSVQNDVDNEEVLARRFARVAGAVYRQTCTRTGDAEVTALGPGRVVLGAWPEAGAQADPELEERLASLAGALGAAGYDVGVSGRIAEDLWLKLCVNLTSAVNALVRPADHATEAFVETKARLLEEARDALAAAGVAARSCDGRDRSLEEEIAWHRDSLRRGHSARRLPVYNQVWQALRRGEPPEADRYHLRILALAERHGVGAPANAGVLEALREAVRRGAGPECLPAGALCPRPRRRPWVLRSM